MASMRPRSWQRLTEYAESDRHATNRFCHTVGIPQVVAGMVTGGVRWWLAKARGKP